MGMESSHSFSRFLTLLQTRNDSVAQQEIWQRSWPGLVRIVAKRLNRKYCAAADEEDVALSAMNSFFSGVRGNEFPRLEGSDDFWSLILTIAYRKASKHHRHEKAQKRGGGNVVNAAGLATDASASLALPLDEISPPSEEEITVMVEEMMEDLQDPIMRQVVVLRLQGCADAEIAAKLGCSEAKVRRKRELIKQIWCKG
jgi:DNA-directed RNA polymerase specialized sigma24 family protein